MFALLNIGSAKCLVAYKDIQQGAIVPPVNELWSQVEEWVAENGWADYVEPEPQKPKEPTELEKAELARTMAYADLITGSDKYFAEAMRKRAAGDEQGAIEAEQIGLQRVLEIKEQYPLPS